MESFDLTGATLIDGTGSVPRPANLRVADGRIAAVWTGSDAPPSADGKPVASLDLTGRTVVPGLIDAHCHVSYGEGRASEEVDVYGGEGWASVRAVWNAAKVLRAGFTSICDPGSTWQVAVTARDAINNGMFPGPRMFSAGRHITADGGFIDYFPTWLGIPVSAEGVLCQTLDEMIREVRQQVKNRVDMIKISGDSHAQDHDHALGPCFTDHEMQSIVSVAHQLGRKTAIHARYRQTVLAAIRAKVDWIYHASYLLPEDVGLVRDSGTRISPTLTFTANIVEWGKEVGVDNGYIEFKKRELEALADIHRRLYEAGVTMMAGSETGFAITPYGEWNSREIELMHEVAGLSPMDALLSATRNNAEAFGWKDVGTLQPGSRADFLVLDGDPLANLSILADPDHLLAIYKDGRQVEQISSRPYRRRMGHERGYRVSSAWLHRQKEGVEVAWH